MNESETAASGGSDKDTINESIFIPRPCMQAAQLFHSEDKVDKRIVKLFKAAHNKKGSK